MFWQSGQNYFVKWLCSILWMALTPSLPQPVKFLGWKVHTYTHTYTHTHARTHTHIHRQTHAYTLYTGVSANSIFFHPIILLFSMLYVFMKILLHANMKKKTKRLKISNFTLLLVVFKWHQSSERVNSMTSTGRGNKYYEQQNSLQIVPYAHTHAHLSIRSMLVLMSESKVYLNS